MNKLMGDYNKTIFWVSFAIIAAIIIWGITSVDTFSAVVNWCMANLTDYFGWWLILLVATVTLLFLWIICSKYGGLKLGLPSDKPEYSGFSWFAMLFSCGIGVGFLFWGIAEPMTHFMSESPYITDGLGTAQHYSDAMNVAMFHWGIHGWIGYMALGLPLAYFAYRIRVPMSPSYTWYGLVGNRVKGPIGTIINIVSIFATVLGVSTTVGMGIMQTSYAIPLLFGIEPTTAVLAVFTLLIIISFTASSISGLNRGIKHLSRINIYLAIFFMVFMFCVGPSKHIINLILETSGLYATKFIYMTFYTNVAGDYSGWINGWTVFYWAWWLSWGPFTGGFVARISKGRSIRQLLVGSLLLPTAFTLVWFCTLGGTAMYDQVNGIADIASVLSQNLGAGVYALLEVVPLTGFFNWFVTINLFIFIVTTADSASFLVAMMSTNGKRTPKMVMRLIWGFGIGSISLLLLISGGLSAVQTSSVVAALPLSIVTAGAVISMMRVINKYEFKTTDPDNPPPYVLYPEIKESAMLFDPDLTEEDFAYDPSWREHLKDETKNREKKDKNEAVTVIKS